MRASFIAMSGQLASFPIRLAPNSCRAARKLLWHRHNLNHAHCKIEFRAGAAPTSAYSDAALPACRHNCIIRAEHLTSRRAKFVDRRSPGVNGRYLWEREDESGIRTAIALFREYPNSKLTSIASTAISGIEMVCMISCFIMLATIAAASALCSRISNDLALESSPPSRCR